MWHCILSAELTRTHSFRMFFENFAHWAWAYSILQRPPLGVNAVMKLILKYDTSSGFLSKYTSNFKVYVRFSFS